MGELATILEFAHRQHSPSGAATSDVEEMGPARLIPGSYACLEAEKIPQSAWWAASRGNAGLSSLSWQKLALRFLPESLKLLHASMLGTAVLDLFLIRFAFCIAIKPVGPELTAFSASAIWFYIVMFLFFAAQGELYRAEHRTLAVEGSLIIKAILWTTVLAGLALKSTSREVGALPLLLVSGMSICFLTAARWSWNSLWGPRSVLDQRNVLVVGDSRLGQRVADAIRSDLRSNRCLRGFLPEHHFRDGYGSAMLRRIARQECVDEVIVASQDVQVTKNVIRAAQRNQLDVRIISNFEGTGPLELEILGSVALLKIHEQLLPQWQLAGKRVADVVLASAGLLVLAPLLLLIAAIIKLDSPGSALYRAERVGQRGARFICCKFRTMTPQADAEKDSLRSLNQRQGAFFKILNDPRITRVGRYLRRYSLDELPQLWNVLRGEMSLVGPRPHPPDDVESYSVEHMQRLDFVPGITGLWQVTARQDPSFERSVALDVEYITRWSLLLDFRILCRTVAAVLQGSGA
jgi:exopolysaccharide biosynthesis polyprenyl glycosylphosphotransferase